MSWHRDMIFGRNLDSTKPPIRGPLIAILVLALLLGVAWHYGIITSTTLVLKDLAVGIWNMLCSIATAVGDFLQYLLGQRSH